MLIEKSKGTYTKLSDYQGNRSDHKGPQLLIQHGSTKFNFFVCVFLTFALRKKNH